MSALVHIHYQTVGENHHVFLTGELDVTSADDVHRALVSSPRSIVVVDLSGLSFIDSTGIAALLTAKREITAAGSRVELRGAQGTARRAFIVAGLEPELND